MPTGPLLGSDYLDPLRRFSRLFFKAVRVGVPRVAGQVALPARFIYHVLDHFHFGARPNHSVL